MSARPTIAARPPVRSLSGLSDADVADLLRDGRRFADALRGARIVVTGATGWFGTWLLDALVALDAEFSLGLSVVAVSRDPDAFRRRHPTLHEASAIAWLKADVRDPLDVVGPVTHVIHAAADTGAGTQAEAPGATFATIVDGTRRVLDLAARHRGTRVLVVSSGAVYGRQPADVARLTEDHRGGPDPLDVASAYAEGKRAAETLAAIAHARHDVHATIARCFAFVGPHMPLDAHFAIGNFVRDAVAGSSIAVAGDGRPRRSYLYPTDLVAWLLAVLLDGRPARAYNVGSPDALTIAELAHRCAMHAGDGRSAVRIGSTTAPGRDYVPDVARATTELGVRVTVPLVDAIARTAAWARGAAR